jgi:2-oxoisovalerate dehydrogenase E1 component
MANAKKSVQPQKKGAPQPPKPNVAQAAQAPQAKNGSHANGANGTANGTANKGNGTGKYPTADYLFDIKGFDKATLTDWYATMQLGRKLDEKAASYLKLAKGWSYHAPYAGHDGIQLALGKIFRQSKDFLYPYYRDLLTCFAAGITADQIIMNGLSKDSDISSGGRNMSNHFASIPLRIQNRSALTGNHSQMAAGTARAVKKFKGDEVVYYSAGESACSEGYFYEAVNGATREKLPVIFVLQNNRYGISVPLHEQTANLTVSDNFRGFANLLIINVDGRNPFECYRALEKAREHALAGKGPAMVHADCDRILSHSNSDNHELYRDKADIVAMKDRDPLPRLRATLIEKGILTEAEIIAIEDNNKKELYAAADRVEPLPEPDPASITQFLLPEAFYTGADDANRQDDPNQMLTFREGINLGMKEEFRRNPHTYLWGQDVASGEKQGIFNVPKGMMTEFGNDRVFNAPIAEDFIVGTANGFCRYRDDARVVVEGAEFADYFWPAMEAYVECTHEFWRTKGQYSPNMVIRLASGGYIQGGLYHSQNLDVVFSHLPGARVVCPAFADDAVGLMHNAIRSKGLTVFIEPKFLYNYRPTSAPHPGENFLVPFGKARTRRAGRDITIISYGSAIHWSLQAAETLAAEGIEAEVIDLRTIAPWDRETVYESVKRTSRALVAHEHYLHAGLGGEIASSISEELFRYLDAPVGRVASKDYPVGFAKVLERAILLSPEDVVAAARKTVRF